MIIHFFCTSTNRKKEKNVPRWNAIFTEELVVLSLLLKST